MFGSVFDRLSVCVPLAERPHLPCMRMTTNHARIFCPMSAIICAACEGIDGSSIQRFGQLRRPASSDFILPLQKQTRGADSEVSFTHICARRRAALEHHLTCKRARSQPSCSRSGAERRFAEQERSMAACQPLFHSPFLICLCLCLCPCLLLQTPLSPLPPTLSS